MKKLKGIFACTLLLAGACGGDDDEGCDLASQDGCSDGFSCEVVSGQEEPACFASVVVRGGVFDLADDSAIEGARVVALDPNQGPASSVDVSEADGSYELVIPAERNSDGEPIGYDITLRADAAGYLTFPGGLRQALPVDTGAAVRDGDDGPWVVEIPLTDIGLIANSDAGSASIRGSAEIPDTRVGVLVVAESGNQGYSAIADRGGSYQIFNLPAGDYEVKAYAQGVNYGDEEVTLAATDTADVDVNIADENAATMTGMVSIVNGGNGDGTSVILVVESTFDDLLIRGATPPGMRAPQGEIEPSISGEFTLEGVPAGTYYVLAAFEDDFLVRDPDPCIAGTDLVLQTVTVGEDLTVEDSFKITGALDLVSPGANGPEAVSATPTFTWKDDSSEEAYDILVVNTFGEVVWETRIDGQNGGDASVAYGGPALEAGVYYQVRITSVRKVGDSPECKIAATEDLKGVFYLE